MLKFNKIPIFLVICVLIVTFAFGIWFLVYSGEDEEKTSLDIGKLYKVNIYGTQGEGYVDIQIDATYLNGICDAMGVLLTDDDVKPKITKSNNLSNGDKFTVSLLNEEAVSKCGIIVSPKVMTYSVVGLKDGTTFDVFSDLVVVIEEEQLIIDNSKCSNFVNDNVDFFIKDQLETYKEGDTVIVGAYIDMNAATDNGYIIEENEKEFIIISNEE